MTLPVAQPLVHRAPAAQRADRTLAVALVGAIAVLGALVLALALAPAPRPGGAVRTALVVDAGGRPGAALARAQSMAGPGVAVRVPRTASEAAVNLRYFGAAGYPRVVAVGPAARAAVRDVASRYPRTRFVVR
jgi:hypothetical protein